MLQTILFLASFFTLSFFLVGKESGSSRRQWGGLFLLAIGAYGAFAFLGYASTFRLIIDIAALLGGSLIVNTFSNTRIASVVVMLALASGYYYVQEHILFPSPAEKAKQQLKRQHQELDINSELLVELKPGHLMSELKPILDEYKLRSWVAFSVKSGAMTDLDDFHAVNIPTEQMSNLDEIIAKIQQHPAVDFVEENEVVALSPMKKSRPAAAQNQPRLNEQINDPEINKVWGFESMQVADLYQFIKDKNLKPKKKARIAIIDTGVDGKHEDLSGNFISTRAEYDQDGHGHGTHCAGIAASVTNNGKGIASFALSSDFVEVTSVQVFDARGRTSQQKILAGMIEAVDNGADVLSMSLGGLSTEESQRAYKEAVEYANKKGAIVVVAAGNESMDASLVVPASVEGVIVVAALGADLNIAEFSNDVSKLKMGIAAPGVDIYSTTPNNTYEFYSGTSMATPYVAGLVGLLKSLRPDLNTRQIYDILHQTGRALPSGKATGNLIQPFQAVKRLR